MVTSWTQICKNNFNKSNNTNLQLIQYKVIHRIHYTGEKLYKMGYNESDRCTHCSQNTADTYLHATWLCSPIRHFWLQVTDQLSHVLDCHIPLSPELCILGDLSALPLPLRSTTSSILFIALTIAKKTPFKLEIKK